MSSRRDPAWRCCLIRRLCIWDFEKSGDLSMDEEKEGVESLPLVRLVRRCRREQIVRRTASLLMARLSKLVGPTLGDLESGLPARASSSDTVLLRSMTIVPVGVTDSLPAPGKWLCRATASCRESNLAGQRASSAVRLRRA